MNIKIKIKSLFNKKQLFFIIIIFGFSFLAFTLVSAYPIESPLGYESILPRSPDLNLNNIINFDIQALVQDSLQKTVKEIPSFNSIFQAPSAPLNSDNTTIQPSGNFGFKDLLNIKKDLTIDNSYGPIKSVIVLVLKLFIVAFTTIIEVLKVFVDLLTKSFK